MTSSQQAIDAIKAHEGFRATMYLDAAGRPTIGYGTLIDRPEEQWMQNATISQDKAEELLRRDLVPFEKVINDTITVQLAQNQFDALVSLVYNIGPTAFRNGSLPRLINGRSDALAISSKWKEYNKAGGLVLAGLDKRRKEEVKLYWQHLHTLSVILVLIAAVALLGGATVLLA
jgi:lysozyme